MKLKQGDGIDPHNYLASIRELDPHTVDYSMEAFDFILNALPVIRVKEENGLITIGGFEASNLASDIDKAWKSKRVANSLFVELTSRKLSFYSFFAIEVVYMLETLALNKKGTRTAKAKLIKLINALKEDTWLATVGSKPSLPVHWENIKRNFKSNIKLLPMQVDFINAYADLVPKLNLRGLYLAAPPGTGKTIAGYGFCEAMDSDLSIFICEKKAIDTPWYKTMDGIYKKKPKHWTSDCSKPPKGDEKIIICHYQALGKLLDHISKYRNRMRITVWIDESHNFNEYTTGWTQNLITICRTLLPKNVIWASGTPFKAIGKEAVPMMLTTDPLFTEQVMKAFVGIFGSTTARALDILNNRTSKIKYHIDKKDVVDNEKVEVTINVSTPDSHLYTLTAVKQAVKDFVEARIEHYKLEMPGIVKRVNELLDIYASQVKDEDWDEYRNYRRMIDTMHKRFNSMAHKDYLPICKNYEKNHIALTQDKATEIEFRKLISRYKYVSLVIRGEALGRVVTRKRIDAVKSMIPHIDFKATIDSAEAKSLFFTNHVDVVEAAGERLVGLGYKPELIYGKTAKDIDAAIDRMATGPQNPAVATYKLLSTATPMIMCNAVNLIDMPFRDYTRDQAISRIDRLGQRYTVRIYKYLLDTKGEKNITDRTLDIVEWSKSMVDAIMGDNELDTSMESIYYNQTGTKNLSNPDEDYVATVDSREVWYKPMLAVRDFYNVK